MSDIIKSFIGQMLRPREKEKGVESTIRAYHIYDASKDDELMELAEREGTTKSAIVTNAIEFILAYRDAPQQSLDSFHAEAPDATSDRL